MHIMGFRGQVVRTALRRVPPTYLPDTIRRSEMSLYTFTDGDESCCANANGSESLTGPSEGRRKIKAVEETEAGKLRRRIRLDMSSYLYFLFCRERGFEKLQMTSPPSRTHGVSHASTCALAALGPSMSSVKASRARPVIEKHAQAQK